MNMLLCVVHNVRTLISQTFRVSSQAELHIAASFLMLLQKYDLIFSNHLELLKQFVAERRTLPSQKDTYKGSNLGAWASNQRANYKNKKLSADRVTKLEEIPGWKWTVSFT